MEKYSFQRGFGQVKRDDLPKIKEEIMSFLGIKTKVSWYNRLNGHIEPKITEVEGIEAIFASYGIKKVWGDSRLSVTENYGS